MPTVIRENVFATTVLFLPECMCQNLIILTVRKRPEHRSNAIAAGKIKTNPPDWRVTKNEDCRNTSVQIDFDVLRSVFPIGGPRFFSSKFVCPPELFDDDHLRLTTAALWIATQRGSVECNVSDVKVSELAFDALFKKIREDLIDLIGKRRGQGDPVKIPGYVLLDIPIDYPYQEGSEFIFSKDTSSAMASALATIFSLNGNLLGVTCALSAPSC